MINRNRSASILTTYLMLTILFCSLPYVLIAEQGLRGGDTGYVTALMWGPAAAAIVTIWWKRLDWRRLGFAWRGTSSSWASYALPIGYTAVAYGLVWATGMGGFAQPEQVQALGRRLGWTITDPGIFVPLYVLLVGTTGMVVATARGLGEEIGWRGFMAPLLHDRFGFSGGALVTGLIWGVWHVPLILFSNYNSDAPRWFALTCFFVMIMNMSFIMAWFRLRSGSVWPAAIMHGSHNLFIQVIFTPLTAANGPVTAYAIDEFGFMLPLSTFIVASALWWRRDRAVATYEMRKASEGAESADVRRSSV